MQNRIFFPQPVLDQWLSTGKVDLRGNELAIVEQERRYEVTEAVYFQKEVSGSPDQNKLVGRVKPREQLERGGAELMDTSCIVGDNAYDVVPGWVGIPIGTFEEHRSRHPSGEFGDEPKTDEDLLARFVLGSLK